MAKSRSTKTIFRVLLRGLLDHRIDEARRRGLRRLSLETGCGPAFEPALALYRKRGFADYARNAFNQFMHIEL